jgi:hypothetical protein
MVTQVITNLPALLSDTKTSFSYLAESYINLTALNITSICHNFLAMWPFL